MTKHNRWKGSMKNHIDPEKDEELKGMKIGIGSNVKKILKLAKNINPGNKDGNLKKRAELIHLVEEFSQQYELLYSRYEDLRLEAKKIVEADDTCSSSTSSTSISESELYYSPQVNSEVSSHASENPETGTNLELDFKNEVKKTKNLDPEIENVLQTDSGIMVSAQSLPKLKDLEEEVERLKLEIETVRSEKKRLEEQFECKSNEAMEMKERISGLESQIMETEASSSENERQVCLLRKQCEGNEREYKSRILELSEKANGLQLEVNNLLVQKGEVEERLLNETERNLSKVKSMMNLVASGKQELASVSSQKSELELELKKKSEAALESLNQIEFLRNELKRQESNEKERTEDEDGIKVEVKDLEMVIQSLNRDKNELKERIEGTSDQASRLNLEKEELNGKINKLQTSLLEKENEISSERQKFHDLEEDLSTQIKFWKNQAEILENRCRTLQEERQNLERELESLRNLKKESEMELEKEKEKIISQMEKKNAELTNKITEHQKTLLELGEAVDKLKDENENLSRTKLLESKSNFGLVEKKTEEMAEELRKQFEDKYRILSRRIRVAEQLHVENKEWYRKTKEAYEEETKELKEMLAKSESGLECVKNMSLAANDVLNSLDPVALRFEECTANFMNRISKASCELKFAKDWAMRKNRALLHVKDDLECILGQLDDKEAEILVFREKVWKSENKVRELEKMIKEREDGMLVLKEEKREAIRQLCVWIDYHRSRSDYYKKMLSDMNLGRRKTS